jgi:putative Mn2+ efflux pump MntP
VSPLVILGIALGLAMDCFAVALGASVTLRRATARQTFRLAFHFGLFQFLMPVLGWLAGLTVASLMAKVDHWVAFGLLTFIGSKVIFMALREKGGEARAGDPTRGASLVMLSVATSIDALAVGFSFAMLGVRVWGPSVVIGVVSGAMTVIGMELGSRLGARFGRRMEILGGLVLIAIGIKILLQHIG